MAITSSYECLDYNRHCNDRPTRPDIALNTIETSHPGLQNIVSKNPILLGSIVDRTKTGRSIQLNGNRLIFSVAGLYLVTYSTSAVWTRLPYGTNEAIIQLKLNQKLLDGSETRVQVLTPDLAENQKANLAKTVLVPVTTRNSSLTLINTSLQIMGFINTTVTVVKVG
ncbi:hypothetical protein K9O30_19110 [Clostridium bowmanii]|uniref:hypothetical protein n=1 Tax=Clostridium bowmanii TaxID=132925 RepID=UPI001C0B9BD5|nr:hypothetical protein [Clostridium bowmanii]MBU3191363.1 hypothetical protein [Clostridium bowmanii]MCA1075792.1 hypothetical protein [Clostridium bowmanii]